MIIKYEYRSKLLDILKKLHISPLYKEINTESFNGEEIKLIELSGISKVEEYLIEEALHEH